MATLKKMWRFSGILTRNNVFKAKAYCARPLCASTLPQNSYLRTQFNHKLSKNEPIQIDGQFTSKQDQNSYSGSSSRSMLLASLSLALPAFLRKEDKKEDEELVTVLKWAQLKFQQGEHTLSMKYYHKALETLANMSKDGKCDEDYVLTARVYIMAGMGNVGLALGQLQQAEVLFKETMKGLLQLGKLSTDNSIVEISLKLALVYTAMGKDEMANVGYNYCIETLKDKLEEQDMDEEELNNLYALLGMCINTYGKFLLDKDRLPESEKQYRESLVLCEEVYGKEGVESANLHNDLACVCLKQGNTIDAGEHLQKAIKIGEAIDSSDLPHYLVNTAALYIELGQLNTARDYCNRGLNMAMKNEDAATEKQAKFELDRIAKKEDLARSEDKK